MDALRRRGWTVLAGWGVLACVVYLVTDDPAVRVGCLAGTAVLSTIATLTGMVLHRPRAMRFWALTALTQVSFLVGAMVRPWSVAQTGVGQALADAFTLGGYASLICGLALILRSRGRVERFALADGVLVCLGALAMALVLFALPAAAIPNRPQWVSVLAGLYPVLDVVILLILMNFGFTTAGRLPSYLALSGSIGAVVVGDVGYAWIGAQGQLVGSPLLDLPFVAAFSLYGITALHPSMTRLSSPAALPVQDWSPRRLALLVPAIALPSILLAVLPDVSAIDRVILASATLAAVGLLVVRAVSAVHGHVTVQQVLRHQATRDGLTGLLSRQALGTEVETLLATTDDPRGVWAIAVDLDNFRFVNDTWGHGTGDQLLVEIARRLQSVQEPGAILARSGGDEFVLVVEAGRDEVDRLAETIRRALRSAVEVDGMEFVVTASLGIAPARRRGRAIDLLRDADTAMSGAKAEGRDRASIFDDDMRQRVRDRLEIEMALRYALERGQFWVAYQPLIDMETERVIGCEALLRWNHPARGGISPADFIPVAEETGLINELGAWVLGESAHQVARWRREGVADGDFVVSVNVSPRQLADGGMLGVVAAALQSSGLPAANLVLEVTESVMLTRPDQTLEVLHRLRDLGVGVSLDDFGTGYSSLSHLSRLPVTTVKLDRSFVDRLDGTHGDTSIVHAVQAMSTALNLSLVAEGVETRTQYQALRALGVPIGQGWLWGAAVGAERFRETWSLLGPATPETTQAAAPSPDAQAAELASTGSGTSNAQ